MKLIMETNKKLELLTGMVDKFNLSVNDVVSYWMKSGRLNLDAATVSSQVVSFGKDETLNLDAATVSSQVVSSRKYETPKRVFPGMYIYADGLIYPEIIEGRQVMAIVGSVDVSDVLAVCLQETCLPWSSDWLHAEATQKMTSGKEATRKILEISREKQQKAEAAQWCYDYAEDGVKQGEAFLPSLTELKKLFANKTAINASLKALGVALLEGWLWSSTEYLYNLAWNVYFYSGYRGVNCKDNGYYVRPVLARKL